MIFSAMEQFKPTDATTNPSLILAAANQKKYAPLLEKAVYHAKKVSSWVYSFLQIQRKNYVQQKKLTEKTFYFQLVIR